MAVKAKSPKIKKPKSQDHKEIAYTQDYEVDVVCRYFVMGEDEFMEVIKDFKHKHSRVKVYAYLKKLGYPKPLNK